MIRPLLAPLAALALAASPVRAAPLARDQVPEALRPWVDWALRGHERELCPFLQGAIPEEGGAPPPCAWPGPLTLDVGEREGRFSQTWRLYAESWVPLPGDASAWPQDVRAGERPAAVVAQGDRPGLRLPAGTHAISGRFAWAERPNVFALPPETGLLRLALGGEGVPFPRRDESGRLWLGEASREEAEEASQEIVVHRRIADDAPMLVETRVEVRASGRSRELLLGRALLESFTPMSLASPVPARLEPDGKLRVQVRAGTWTITLLARGPGRPLDALALGEPDGPWDADEVWSFEARPALRLVDVAGAPAVDPSQTAMPDEWRSLPAFLVRPGEALTFSERRRGDADPAPDKLALERVWWLDFGGGGYTVRDKLTGEVRRSSRLEMGAPGTLGRVSVNGTDQFITRLAEGGPLGVEVRQQSIAMEADSRVEGGASPTPAVGWNQDFHSVSGVLHLPPGWRLLAAWGVDDANPTWISAWTLLDLFLALVIAAGASQLWGRRAGLLAAATLAAVWTEPGAPTAVWIAVLAAEALHRALSQEGLRERFPGIERGRFAQGVRLFRLASLVVLAVTAVPFMIQQVRSGMFPALEHPFMAVQAQAPAPMQAMDAATQAAPQEGKAEGEADEYGELRDAAKRALSKDYPASAPVGGRSDRNVNVLEPDPSARVQTGPGLPSWTWNQAVLRWNGPVERDQEMRLWFLPPWANFALALLRTALVAALIALVVGLRGGRWKGLLASPPPPAPAAAAALLLALALPGAARAEEFPSKELLDELRARLLEKPECAPECGAAPRMAVEAAPGALRLRLAVNVEAATAVPLPGDLREWSPETVLVDGAPASGLLRTPDGRLWVALAPGAHDLLLEGALPKRDTVRIPLPLVPRRAEVRAEGWTVDGILPDGRAEESLQLTRESEEKEEGAALEPGTLPPFVQVDREIRLGLSWSATTRVARLTPPGSPVVLEVPLLSGEAIVTQGVEAEGGVAKVTLGPQTSFAEWRSTLKESPEIALSARESASFMETWRVDATPIWHVEAQGIPWVHQESGAGPGLREWRPWPGETVSLSISRPQGAGGRTLTADRASLVVSPGIRATDASLELALRSSQGGQHTVTLPEGAALESVEIGGLQQPIRAEGRSVTFPVVPGAQVVKIAWRQTGGIAGRFRTPQVDAGLPVVNAEIQANMPADRWTLFLWGPRVGPTVLFWSFLAVVALACWALGKVPFTPLRMRHWLLLSLGLTQVDAAAAALLAGWALVLGRRKDHPPEGRGAFNFAQVALAVWTLAALATLFAGIEHGLLGLPEMQIAGNGSYAQMLRWYQDRSEAALPTASILSAPLWVYRAAMLAWALWLARAMVGWMRWAWTCYTAGGLWRPAPPRPPRAPRPPAPGKPGKEGIPAAG